MARGRGLSSFSEECCIPDEWSKSVRPACAVIRPVYPTAVKPPAPAGQGQLEEYDPRKSEYMIDAPHRQVKEAEAELLEQQASALAAMIRTREKTQGPGSKILHSYRVALGNLQRDAHKARTAANLPKDDSCSRFTSYASKSTSSGFSPRSSSDCEPL